MRSNSDSSFDSCEPETSRSLGVPILLAVPKKAWRRSTSACCTKYPPRGKKYGAHGLGSRILAIFFRVGQAFVEVLSKFDFEKWTLSDEEPDKCLTFWNMFNLEWNPNPIKNLHWHWPSSNFMRVFFGGYLGWALPLWAAWFEALKRGGWGVRVDGMQHSRHVRLS